MIKQHELKDKLHYCPISGTFTWIVRANSKVCCGSMAGSVCKHLGYTIIRINGVNYRAHRLAFLYMLGEIPEYVDHRNRVRTDNRWKNIRPCTREQNQYNKSIQKNNSSGFKGVSYCKLNKKFRAQAKIKGVRKTIGYFPTAEEANKAYIRYTKDKHREFAVV